MEVPFEGVVHPAFALQPFVPEESLKKLPSPPRNEMLVVTFAEWTPSEGERRAEDVSLEHTKRRLLIEFYVKYRGLFIDCAHYMHKFFRVSPELCFVALHKQEIVGTIRFLFYKWLTFARYNPRVPLIVRSFYTHT